MKTSVGIKNNSPLQSMYGLGSTPTHGNKHHHTEAKIMLTSMVHVAEVGF